MNAKRPFHTVPEVARMFGRTPARLYQMIRDGELPATEVGGRIVIPGEALEQWLRTQTDRALASVAEA